MSFVLNIVFLKTSTVHFNFIHKTKEKYEMSKLFIYKTQ